MSKPSTMSELLHSDLVCCRNIMGRYFKSSSLSIGERQRNKPKVCQFRRDKVLRKLIKIQMNYITSRATDSAGGNDTE